MATKKAAPKKPVAVTLPEKQPGFGQGFTLFLRQYSVIPLAIAVVLGNAVNDMVQALVKGIITPLIALVWPSTALQSYQWTVHKSTFEIGTVISAIISFIVVALVVYTLVKKVLHDDTILQKK